MRLTLEGLKERILYEDREILVLHKPAGTAVESAKVTEPDLASLLRTYLGKPVFIVHRLDQPVGGVMVFARTKAAAADLSAQVSGKGAGGMKKLYRARVRGPVPKESDTLTDFLVRDPVTNLTRVLEPSEAGLPEQEAASRSAGRSRTQEPTGAGAPGKGGPAGRKGKSGRPGQSSGARNAGKIQKAVLRYRRLGENEVEVELLTGRHHQIRAQLAHAGMPIDGDRKYGGSPAPGLALTASSLSFRHPKTGERMTWELREEEAQDASKNLENI